MVMINCQYPEPTCERGLSGTDPGGRGGPRDQVPNMQKEGRKF